MAWRCALQMCGSHLVLQVKQVCHFLCLFRAPAARRANVLRLVVVCSVGSHMDKTTTWHDPRVPQLQSAASQHPIASAPVHAHSLSNPAASTQAQNNITPEPGTALLRPPSICCWSRRPD